MNDIALVTANFGGIDAPKPLPGHPGIEALYYTDGHVPAEVAETWTRVIAPAYPRFDFGPRLRAKYFKTQIHRLDEARQARWLAWADASLRIHQLGVLTDAAAALRSLPEHRRALFIPHPDRGTVLEEFEFVMRAIADGHATLAARYGREKMPEQIAWFRARGWSLDARLWCGGFWMVENSPLMGGFLNDWWDQNLRFGMMDQLSLPVVLAQHGIEPEALKIHLWKNDLFEFTGHVRKM